MSGMKATIIKWGFEKMRGEQKLSINLKNPIYRVTLKIQIIAKLSFCLFAMKNENWKETKLYHHTSNIIYIIYFWFLLQFCCHQCHKLDSSKIAIVEKNIWNVATCWV